MTAGLLTGVVGVARRHRARRNAGDPVRREVAALTFAVRRKLRWVSEGSTVPSGPDNRTGGEGRDPGSGCVSTGQGAGDWREAGISTEAPEAPRGAVHQ